MATADLDKTTTWGDCPNSDCKQYGHMVYGIEPGDYCGQKREEADLDTSDYCYETLRWWDRWHDGEHGEHGECAARLARERMIAAHEDARSTRASR